jgi:hypothetical protein
VVAAVTRAQEHVPAEESPGARWRAALSPAARRLNFFAIIQLHFLATDQVLVAVAYSGRALAISPRIFHRRGLVLAAEEFNVLAFRMEQRAPAQVAAVYKDRACPTVALRFPVKVEVERNVRACDPMATARLDPAKAAVEHSDQVFGQMVIARLVLVKVGAVRNAPVLGPMDARTTVDFPTEDRMTVDSPIVGRAVLAKAAPARGGTATTGKIGRPIIVPIAFRTVIGGMIGAAIVTTMCGNTGTVTGTITITGTTTTGGIITTSIIRTTPTSITGVGPRGPR